MVLLDIVLAEHSKAQCEVIVRWVGKNQNHFNQLLELVIKGKPILLQRASWPLCNAAIANPLLMKEHWKTVLKQAMKEKLPRGVKRNMIKILAEIPFPKKLEGSVMDFCFQQLENPLEEIAVKSWAMKILMKMAMSYPDILPELKLIVEDQYDLGSAGFKAQAKRILAMK